MEAQFAMDEFYKPLLQKFLAGTCTEEESKQVELLIRRPEIRQMLDALFLEQSGDEWESPLSLSESMQERMRAREAEMMQRIAHTARKHSGQRVLLNRNTLRYAAIWTGFLMLAAIALWQFRLLTREVKYTELRNETGIPVRYHLPDGSRVFLAAQSTLKYPEQFLSNRREIQLTGEAFFDVTHDESKPFVIHTATEQTRVLGTSFKVSAFAGEPMHVAVATGKVRVSTDIQNKEHQLAVLTPGQSVTWNRTTRKIQNGSVDIDALQQWKSGELTFQQLPLAQVAQELQRRYSITIRFSGNAGDYHPVSGTFSPHERITDILDMLGMVGKFKYKRNDEKTFTIYPSDRDGQGKKTH